MDLESLKAAWDEAQAEADASPNDKGLVKAAADAKAAYEAAKAEAEEGDPSPNPGEDDKIDESKFDDKTKKYLAKLRGENAKHRTSNKDLKSKLNLSETQKKKMLEAAGIVVDDEKPEEKLKTAREQNNTLVFNNAVLETAVAQGVPAEKLKFFRFLMSEAVSELEEGDELDDEKIAEIVKECKGGKAGKANSTVKKFDKDGKEIKAPSPDQNTGDGPSLEEFCSMGPVAKSKLYLKNEAAYTRLYNEAKSKGKFI